MTPFTKTDSDVLVPCGKCPECRARRASGWSFRLMQQDKVSTSSLFITLTYDTINCPISKSKRMTINKRDPQLFIKKLRKANEQKLKYYLVGEYGGDTQRPHYHLILFNAKIETILPAWGLGNVHYGNVSCASVGYTLKYISKPKTIPQYKNDDRTPEFSLMSKGLGLSYLSNNIQKWHKNDLENRMYLNIEDGKKITMPRYYKDKIYNKDERQKIADATLLRISNDLGTTPTHNEWLNRKAGVKAAYQKMYTKDKTKSHI